MRISAKVPRRIPEPKSCIVEGVSISGRSSASRTLATSVTSRCRVRRCTFAHPVTVSKWDVIVVVVVVVVVMVRC